MNLEYRQILERVGSARRVLIVDDHASFRNCARALLESEGYEVVGEAADGESAVSRAAELRPDLVLLDIQLPDVDGFEVAARLLRREPGLSIVLVSSRDESSYRARIDASGARGFVAKADLSRARLERLME